MYQTRVYQTNKSQLGEIGLFFCVFYYLAASITLQPRQPLLRIINLSNTRVGVLPEGEEFLVVLDGFVLLTCNVIKVYQVDSKHLHIFSGLHDHRS